MEKQEPICRCIYRLMKQNGLISKHKLVNSVSYWVYTSESMAELLMLN